MRALLGGRWVGWALMASLALNLFLGGVIGVRFWREHWRDGPERMAGQLGPTARLAAAFPESGREKVKAALDAKQQELRDRGREFRRTRAEALQVLSAEPFDRAKVTAAFAEARRTADAMSMIAQDAIIEAGEKLTSEERKALRDRLAERDRRGSPPQR